MARWILKTPHYLKVAGIEWEYKEVDRKTGRQRTKKFPVPLFLDPNDPADWNYNQGRDEGGIIVSNGGSHDPSDIIFEGDPTPDMIPLDEEAKAISAKFADKWKHPIDGLSPTYSQSMINNFESKMAEVMATSSSVKIEGLDALMLAMTQMMEQNQKLMQAVLADKVQGTTGGASTDQSARRL